MEEKIESRLRSVEAEIKEIKEKDEKRKLEMEAYFKIFGDKIGETDSKIERAKNDIAGISNSNGLVAEDYFFNTLERTLSLGSMRFEFIQRGIERYCTLPNGEYVSAEYDIMLVNGKSIALIEIKYKADDFDVKKFAEKDAKKFRLLFPEYAKRKLYLGVAGLSINKNTEKGALARGMAVLKQKGDAIEVLAGNLRAY